jgi:LytS/YehU family sensor histidine kinase
MNPHILFNAFNGLAELVVRDPRAAERSIRSLAGLMRKLLDATERSAYSLDEERALVEDYLAAEALRLGARLRVDWTWDEGLGDLPFIPLLLQPLVENAIKHGIALTEGGGDLRLGASMEGARLRLEVRNTGQAPPPAIREGVGLRNLRSRLSWAYGDAAGVALRREGDWTVARMWLEPYLISHLPTETTHGRPQDRPGG